MEAPGRPGLNFERLPDWDNTYSIRVTRSYRILLKREAGEFFTAVDTAPIRSIAVDTVRGRADLGHTHASLLPERRPNMQCAILRRPAGLFSRYPSKVKQQRTLHP